MKSFTDSKGRSWTIAVHVSSIQMVKAETGIDLAEAYSGGSMIRDLLADPVLPAQVILALCTDQVAKYNTDLEDLSQSITGEAADAALKALIDDIVDFSPGRLRPALRAAIARADEQMALASTALVEKIESPEVMTKFKSDLAEKISGISATNAPASSASIQGT